MIKRLDHIRCRVLILLVAIALFAALVPASIAATTKVYYNIDFSQEVLASRVDQRVSGGCAVAAMATVESYMYGAKTEDEIEAVYDALIDINGKANYAYWSRCGFSSSSTISWSKVYDQLAAGYPCLIHRKATSSASEHWSVVAGYFGSTTKLEKDKFLVVEVNNNFQTEIYTSAEWGKGTSIDKMVIRKSGIPYTDVEGITFAVNHPAVVHEFDKAQNVYGHITANEELIDIRIQVTDLDAGSDIYDKTVEPAAKYYNINVLDKEMAYSAWPVGRYFLTITARTSSDTKVYQHYFEIRTDWPDTPPQRLLNITYDEDHLQPHAEQIPHMGTLTAPQPFTNRVDRAFITWNIRRNDDGKWFCSDGTWRNDEELMEDPALLRNVAPGDTFVLDHTWLRDQICNSGYTFVARWEQLSVYGDINGDGAVTTADLDILRGYLAARELANYDLPWGILPAADCSGDGSVNSMDLSLLIGLLQDASQEDIPVQEPAADGPFHVTVDMGHAYPGEEVSVDVILENNAGFHVLCLGFDYDSNYLTLTGVTNRAGDLTMTHGNSLIWDGISTYREDGVLATLHFKISEDAPLGPIRVEAVVMDGCTEDLQQLQIVEVAGSVQVLCSHGVLTEVPACEPDCVTDGNALHYLCDCGAVLDANKVPTTAEKMLISAVGHDHQVSVTKPTCTAKGYSTYTCHCGDTYIDNYVEALGHHYEVYETIEPTAKEDGCNIYRCNGCGDEYTEAVPATGAAALWGDVDGNGDVDYMDAYLLMRCSVDLISADGVDLTVADVNGDGQYDYMDAYLIMRYSVGLIDRFPVE